MGQACFMCGLDYRTVKLGTIEFAGAGSRGGNRAETVCEHCKELALDGVHPDNKTLSEENSQQGFIKPSAREGA